MAFNVDSSDEIIKYAIHVHVFPFCLFIYLQVSASVDVVARQRGTRGFSVARRIFTAKIPDEELLHIFLLHVCALQRLFPR